MRDIIINADDYAMDGAVDEAIIALAVEGAVSSASAMVLSPRWKEAARALADAPLSRGLHLDFTSPFSREIYPGFALRKLVACTHARLLERAAVKVAIDRQLGLFENRLGCAPDFVDGHQHVHHLPIIRDALLEALADRYGEGRKTIGIRICIPRHWRGWKAAAIANTGAFTLARLTSERACVVNTDFAGVYDFGADADLSALWQGWLTRLEGPFPLIMCHVAVPRDRESDTDPIRQARLCEYRFLASEEFRSLRELAGAKSVRWPRA